MHSVVIFPVNKVVLCMSVYLVLKKQFECCSEILKIFLKVSRLVYGFCEGLKHLVI